MLPTRPASERPSGSVGTRRNRSLSRGQPGHRRRRSSPGCPRERDRLRLVPGNCRMTFIHDHEMTTERYFIITQGPRTSDKTFFVSLLHNDREKNSLHKGRAIPPPAPEPSGKSRFLSRDDPDHLHRRRWHARHRPGRPGRRRPTCR